MRRLAALLLIALASCGSPTVDESGTPTARLVIATESGRVPLKVEIADDADEREHGLMGRERLAPYDGMAFLWDEPVRTSFWMKDTLIALSVAFWDEEGRIVAILDMEPCESDPCSTYDPGTSFVGAVEVDRGLFDDRGVEVGDRVELMTEPA